MRSDPTRFRTRPAPASTARRTLAATAALLLTACGGGDSGGGGGDGGTGPVTPAPLNCTAAAAPAPRTETYRTDTSTPASRRALDVYVPARSAGCPPAPMVVYFHGGGYVTGDKGNQIADKARLFAAEGWTFVSVNYRLSPFPVRLDDPDRVRYPAAQDDAATALAWAIARASTFGADPGRVAVMGHSAGAHLAALVSTDPTFLQARGLGLSALRCTVALDTEAYDLPRFIAEGGDADQLYRNAIGTDEATLRAASPRWQARAGSPSHFVVTRGSAQRRQQAADHAAALRGVGVRAEVLDASGYTHEQVNSAVGAAGESVVTPPLMQFLRGCLAG